ncbi:hypothetical protein ACIP5L_02800 [Streptomyces bacillaris]|uniref:hypothetical protein n=1 Tax=Streptomyces bacillaris TaxID=68179 RepID=UPI0037FF1EE9
MSEYAFAVGHLVPMVADATSTNHWRESVEKQLNSIPSVRDLSFHEVSDRWLGDRPASGILSFRVTIPERVQNELCLSLWPAIKGVEDFIVETWFESMSCVTFVTCVGGDSELSDPSNAVMSVREFILRELGKLEESDVTLQVLGPSPFHTDFYLSPGKGASDYGEGLSVTLQKSRGYSRCDFFYDSTLEVDPKRMLFVTFSLLARELSGYYYLVGCRNSRLGHLNDLGAEIQEQVVSLEPSGLIKYVRSTVSMRHPLNALRLSLLKAKLSFVQTARGEKQVIDLTYSGREAQVFRSQLESEHSERYSDEIENLESILKMLEDRNSQDGQRIASFFVALVGVMVGSLLTATLRWWAT